MIALSSVASIGTNTPEKHAEMITSRRSMPSVPNMLHSRDGETKP